MTSVNLIPRAYLVRRDRRRRIRAWAVGLAAYAAAAGAGTIVASIMLQGPRAATAEMVVEADDQILQIKRAIATATREAIDWSRRADAERAIGEHPRWGVLLAFLARARGEDVVLTSVDLQSPGKGPGRGPAYRLSIEGMGMTQPAVTRYVLDLEQSGIFDLVTVAEIRATEYGGRPAAAFRLDCTLGQSSREAGK